MNYDVADKVGQVKPKWTKQEHDLMKAAINSKADKNTGGVLWYDCIGDEGNAITFDGLEALTDLAGKVVIEVNKENVEMRPTTTFPTTLRQFNWNTAARTLTFKEPVEAGDQIKIKYI